MPPSEKESSHPVGEDRLRNPKRDAVEIHESSAILHSTYMHPMSAYNPPGPWSLHLRPQPGACGQPPCDRNVLHRLDWCC